MKVLTKILIVLAVLVVLSPSGQSVHYAYCNLI